MSNTTSRTFNGHTFTNKDGFYNVPDSVLIDASTLLNHKFGNYRIVYICAYETKQKEMKYVCGAAKTKSFKNRLDKEFAAEGSRAITIWMM